MSNEGALANLDVPTVLQQLSSGRLLKQIASDYGVVKSAIHKRVSSHPDYKQAIIEQAESLVEIATQQVMECDADTVNIARARVDAAHKWAAARDPVRWGKQPDVVINQITTGDGVLEDLSNLILDKLGTVATQQSPSQIIVDTNPET